MQLDPWSADNVTPRDQGTDAVAVASSVAGTREIAPGTEHGHDVSVQPGEPCRTAVDQRRERTSSEHDAPPLLSSVSSSMLAESRTGLEPDGVLADFLRIPGKRVSFGRGQVHAVVPSDPIFGDGPVSPRGQARPALRPLSFLPHKAPDILAALFVSELPTERLGAGFAWHK